MGFFSRLFGVDKQEAAVAEVEPVEYASFLIYPEAKSVGGQYQVSGRICQEVDGELRTHDFIRSDLMMSKDDANDIMLSKAKRFIDQMGEDIFN